MGVRCWNPFLVAAVSIQRALRRFEWAGRRSHAVMVAGGLLRVTGGWERIARHIQSWLSGIYLPIKGYEPEAPKAGGPR